MAKYDVGDRVRVTNETEGQPVELIGAVGTVTVVDGFLEHGDVRPRTSQKEQLYDVEFDHIGLRQGLWEKWLMRESN